LSFYMIDDRHPLYDPARAAAGWAYWDRLMSWGDEIVGAVLDAAGPDTLVALVSDHGGDVDLPGLSGGGDPNQLLEQHGWLRHGADGAVDWSRTVAYGHGQYVFLNLQGRDPQGIVSPGEEFTRLREGIIEALLDWKDARGRHRYRVVLPREDAGRLAVGGDRIGDIFLVPTPVSPLAKVDRDEFWRTHTAAEVGTWDWPLINAGGHSDDSYFVLAGPGVRQGYRRARPTLITSVAPTAAQAWGVPVPRDADGSVLWDFLANG
jgi:predicted AlkP superfamily phosphohydrolase/phosphomutase